jgi:shikimate kinase
MKNIILIGMSGVGKSVKGRYLAKELGWDFFDTDKMISEELGMTIEEIFEKHGEPYFREKEKSALKRAVDEENRVISTGGGIILDPENVIMMKEQGVVYFLHGSIDSIASNIESSRIARPLLAGEGELRDRIEKLYRGRETLYYSSCHVAIHVDSMSGKEFARKIKDSYRKLLTC